jgi:Txe/YoeB family toxin of Txe-Axe toxin-antitoxin module
MTTTESTLIAHCGASKVDREFLRTLPLPEATRTHQPIPHIQIVDALTETLSFRHINVVRDEYAVTPDGMRCFGLLQLEYSYQGVQFAIGFRNSNDKSLRLAMTVGYRVFICDNLAFKGDFTPVLAKHSKSLNLIDLVSVGVDKIQRNFEPLKTQINDWHSHRLNDRDAKEVIYDAFLDSDLKLPRYLLPAVHSLYFDPQIEEFKPRTLWSLSNAFTSAFKELKPVKQFQVTAKLGDFLEDYRMPF